MVESGKSIKERAADYYRGERISNVLLFSVGGAAIVWTLLLFLWRQGNLSAGLFYSAFPLGAFFVLTGGYRFWRSFKRFDAIKNEQTGEDFLKGEEYSHLLGRADRFRRKRKVDFIGLLVGFVMVGVCIAFSFNHVLLSTAISITGFSAILLVYDLFGQFRTEEVIHHIEKQKKEQDT